MRYEIETESDVQYCTAVCVEYRVSNVVQYGYTCIERLKNLKKREQRSKQEDLAAPWGEKRKEIRKRERRYPRSRRE
jgi:hypothetical protein